MIAPGKTVGGRYKIKSHIGTGGMATVYLAQDLILERPVAVKVLRLDFHTNEAAMRRFQREAQSATQLVHPNIVSVYDVGEEDGTNYIVMEYVEGTDLKEYIRERGPLPPREAVRIMTQIVSAIELAHQNRIIHRDIKPQNILIDREGNVKITDFGIAIALSETSLTQTNTLLGSVHYLSPEQARGGMATIRSDIYALGIVLYELLVGEVPFEGESAVSIALKHFQEPLPRISQMLPTVPQSLENVVLKATAKEPLDRYSSCYEMLEDLQTCLNPERLHEPMFKPTAFSQETKVLQPIATGQIPRKIPATSKEVPEIQFDEEKKAVQEEPKKKKKKIWPWILLLLLIIISAGAIYAFIQTSPKDVKVPDVTNLTEADAKVKLADANLEVSDVQQVKSDTVEAGKVVETNPKAGSSVKEKSKVVLKVSAGKDTVTVGDYTGKTFDEAKAALQKLGIAVEKKESYSDTVESGKVMEQSVAKGEKVVAKDTKMVLTVSKGKEPVTLINLKGYSRSGVEDYAKEHGLKLQISEENSNETADTVIKQSPAEGTALKKGDTLTVVISKGKGERVVSRQFTIPYEAKKTNGNNGNSASNSQEAKQNTVEIFIQDANNNINTAYRTFKISENTSVTIDFTFNNQVQSGKYIIKRDGVAIDTGVVQ
ncbi:MAG: Stk1 family PASTA domain-containing Ser/Thr kinase [Granulicatella adiacens]|nr:Stk1 family PASTA domain-containing Ser/Thr kinase [Granulicatella adiacens]